MESLSQTIGANKLRIEVGDGYQDLVEIQIEQKILDLLPCLPQKIISRNPNYFNIEAPDGQFALWLQEGREATLAFQLQFLKVCEIKGVKGFLYPLCLRDGRSYAKFDERRWFYLTRWPDLRKISFSKMDDVRALINLIVGFRKETANLGLLFCLPERKEHIHLIRKFQEMSKQFYSFSLLAKHRLRPTMFDQLFISFFAEIGKEVKKASNLLKNSEYPLFSTNLTTQNLIIKQFSRSNLRVSDSNEAICLRFTNYRWDLPLFDLAEVLLKTGRSNKWSFDWFSQVMGEYQSHFKLSVAEQKLLTAYLLFPWELYHLCSRYFYNRAEWQLHTYVDKLERLLDDMPKRIGLLAEVSKNYPF